jgi:hypothetical protein
VSAVDERTDQATEPAAPPAEDPAAEGADITEREGLDLDAQLGDGDVHDDDENADQPPAVDDTPPEQAPAASSLADLQAMDKALTSEGKRHENALAKIYSESWEDYLMCPACLGEGFLLPVPPGSMPDEIWLALQSITGHMPTDELAHPANLVRCGRCNGRGEVATGAENDHNRSIPCALCESRGYFDLDNALHAAKLGIAPEIAHAAPPALPFFHTPEAPAPAADTNTPPAGWEAAGRPNADQWGRWPGHTRYGIDPGLPGMSW